jgi:hypothetical protein
MSIVTKAKPNKNGWGKKAKKPAVKKSKKVAKKKSARGGGMWGG